MGNITTELKADVLRITINRPEKKNALTMAMYTALAEAIEQGDMNPDVKVVLLHGDGDSFTAGNDLQDFMANPWTGNELPPACRFMFAVARATKPVIAAVHGSAVGIGVTILLHCDLVYAAGDATLMMPFVNLGIVPEAGSTVLVPLLIGHQRAAELFMLSAPMTAQRAYELGFVNAVVPLDKLMETALGAAQAVAEKPLAALRATKALMKKPWAAAVEQAMQEELKVLSERLTSPECREALMAFLQKRKPDFR
ncbi:MAG TPA: enoyl-CoA hydratase [Candidatus Binatia bacterium]|jgi:enoyl-CoA hydratase/carnithine racemase|nr:enoyl-CoA hydratase [Candidatus Binatia bacterium]